MNSPRIPVARPDLTGNEEKYVVDAIRSSWISSTGPYVERFEREFAEACQVDAAVAVCNGTVALHLAMLALDVRPGDEVLVPALTYVATANAVKYVGGVPVFVDVDPRTWCLDPSLMESAITPRTRGVIAVHLYGHPADMDQINRIAAIHGLWVVEDAAEAPFATYKGRPVGGLARLSTFSFYGNKLITSGEGGAICLSDRSIEIRVRTLRGQGVDPARRYYFPVTGYNFRLTNVACALLCAQLERVNEALKRRRALYDLYTRLLSNVPGLSFQPVESWAVVSPWLFCVVLEDPRGHGRRELVQRKLEDAGIETRPFFVPLHSLPPFRESARQRESVFPEAERLGQTGLNLPTHSMMSEEAVHHVSQVLRQAAIDSRP